MLNPLRTAYTSVHGSQGPWRLTPVPQANISNIANPLAPHLGTYSLVAASSLDCSCADRSPMATSDSLAPSVADDFAVLHFPQVMDRRCPLLPY